jgi:L-2-hydroxyglutarate oxidase LhgO
MSGTFSKLPLRTDRNATYSKMKSNSRLILKQPCNSASTAVWIMLQVVERSFAEKLRTSGWSAKLREIIPSYGQSLIENPALCERVHADAAAVLHINTI